MGLGDWLGDTSSRRFLSRLLGDEGGRATRHRLDQGDLAQCRELHANLQLWLARESGVQEKAQRVVGRWQFSVFE